MNEKNIIQMKRNTDNPSRATIASHDFFFLFTKNTSCGNESELCVGVWLYVIHIEKYMRPAADSATQCIEIWQTSNHHCWGDKIASCEKYRAIYFHIVIIICWPFTRWPPLPPLPLLWTIVDSWILAFGKIIIWRKNKNKNSVHFDCGSNSGTSSNFEFFGINNSVGQWMVVSAQSMCRIGTVKADFISVRTMCKFTELLDSSKRNLFSGQWQLEISCAFSDLHVMSSCSRMVTINSYRDFHQIYAEIVRADEHHC